MGLISMDMTLSEDGEGRCGVNGSAGSLAEVIDRIIAKIGPQAEASQPSSSSRDMRFEAARLWAMAGKRYQRCTLDNFVADTPEKKAVVAVLSEYAANMRDMIESGTNVILSGAPGTGKDHLLAGLCHVALECGFTVDWRGGSELWLRLRRSIDERNEYDMIAEIVRPDVLVLSDPIPPHTEPTNYERAMLYAIVHRRYSNLRPIWVSMNCGRSRAEEILGLAVADRLRHGAVSIACQWDTYRRPHLRVSGETARAIDGVCRNERPWQALGE
jgi:DNA replication protein DnaC